MSDMAAGPLQILPLGIGDAFSSIDYFCSMLVLGGSKPVLVDCPDPIHKILHEVTLKAGLGLDASGIGDVIVTHLHGDHCNGLESLLFYRKFMTKRTGRVTIYALPEVCEALWPRKLSVAMEGREIPRLGITETFRAEDYFRTCPVDQGEPFRIGELEFSIFRTVHSLPSFGLVVSLGGRSFGYSCDTVFDREAIRFLSRADLIFHECTKGRLHTSYKDLMSLDPEIRRKIHILHLADDFDREASELPVVEPGRIYTV
ncbi:ribonuclease Z [Candidatus Sumerlaeota bacterium]|nr:ribonuclease Z [Candidatus Sumerlaeota bacterium]